MTDQLGAFLEKSGFIKIPSSLPEFTIYFQLESNSVNVIHVIDCQKGNYISIDEYGHMKQKITQMFEEKHFVNIHILSLIVGKNELQAKTLCEKDAFCWLLDTDENILRIFEHQVADFYGIRVQLETFLVNIDQYQDMNPYQDRDQSDMERREWESDGDESTVSKGKKFTPYVSGLLTVSNIIIFLLCTYTGDVMYNKGELFGPYILEQGEYYRFLSAMFLHASTNHLMSNLILLFFLGNMIEEKLGHIRFFILYFGAGICGGMASVWYEYYSQRFIGSIGASGAIFGIIGALLLLVLVNKGRLESVTLPRVAFMVVYSVYSGLMSTNVDNAAHLGGLISGFLIVFLFWLVGRRNRFKQ